MKIVQLLPTIAFGDAVSNEAIALKAAILEMGYQSEIYAENIDVRLSAKIAFPIWKMPKLSKDDIIIYHLSTGTDLNYHVGLLEGRKIIVYHNVTPPHFFSLYNSEAEMRSIEGLNGARYLSSVADYVLADSEFNKQNLLSMDYCCQVDVLPILIAFEDYKKKPNARILRKYDDDWTNIIFTGRIAPNKKQEDVIASYYYYKKYINPKSRLFIVGSSSGMESYGAQLKEYVKQLDISEVYFTGHVKFDEILAYYKIADIFLCMSEHEGFCVPLVEAMLFDVPIIAYESSAVGDTLGGSGVLIKKKDHREIAELIHMIATKQELKETILLNQRIRLKDFSHDRILHQFESYLKGFIEKYEK